MKSKLLLLPFGFALLVSPLPSSGDAPPIDFDKAHKIFDRSKRGEAITDEERAYMQRAIQAQKESKSKDGKPARTGMAWALDGADMLPAGEEQRLLKLMESVGLKVTKGSVSIGPKRPPPSPPTCRAKPNSRRSCGANGASSRNESRGKSVRDSLD